MDELEKKALSKLKELLNMDDINFNDLGIRQGTEFSKIVLYKYDTGKSEKAEYKTLFSSSSSDSKFKLLSSLIREIWNYQRAKEELNKLI